MRKPIIAGNWKMNKTPEEAKALVTDLIPLVKDAKCDVVVCPPFVDLCCVHKIIEGTNIHLGCQNIHWAEGSSDIFDHCLYSSLVGTVTYITSGIYTQFCIFFKSFVHIRLCAAVERNLRTSFSQSLSHSEAYSVCCSGHQSNLTFK